MPDWTVIEGDCREILAGMEPKSVHMICTSPPYHGLRDYGLEPSVWGDNAPHVQCTMDGHDFDDAGVCRHLGKRPNDPCPAWRGVLGLEPNVDQYCRNIVECFRAVKRVLRDDGCAFVNCGDSFDAKQLVGQPWRIAFALQADGWYLRSDIIWHKPNPLPESVTDRPTKAHEYVFLLTKQPKYYYDAEAVREAGSTYTRRAGGYNDHHQQGASRFGGKGGFGDSDVTTVGRNKRTVWTIPTEANPEAHFASFPRKLVVPCILAGTSSKGCCPECGAPWRRVVEKSGGTTGQSWHDHDHDEVQGQRMFGTQDGTYQRKTLGWRAGCECMGHTKARALDPMTGKEIEPVNVVASANCLTPVPCTVLDPFLGSGTTLIVANQLGRRGIGIEGSPEYVKMARRRIANPEPEPEIPDAEGQLTMFGEVPA